MMIYKYSQIPTKQIDFDQVKELCPADNKMHLGQFKLFFSELIFLSIHSKPGDRIVYVGAASGYHIGKLADLFPDVNFDLWDPRDFDIDERPNIKKYQQLFTNADAEKYKYIENERILFMCDIRNLKVGKLKKDLDKMDEVIDDDMKFQMEWCQIIRPYYAYLKFRLPYMIPHTKYLTGTIYLQPYAPFSTENRLMTNDYFSFTTYNNIEYDQRMAYFNGMIRCSGKHYNRWKKIMDKYNLKNIWITHLHYI